MRDDDLALNTRGPADERIEPPASFVEQANVSGADVEGFEHPEGINGGKDSQQSLSVRQEVGCVGSRNSVVASPAAVGGFRTEHVQQRTVFSES